MYVQAMCNRHGRGVQNAHIGTTITDPEYRLRDDGARAWGLCRGADHDPRTWRPALKRALAVVKGQPALVDVVTDPR